MWSAETRELLQTLEGHNRTVLSAAFSPGGEKIVSASYDNTVRVWSAETGELLQTLEKKGVALKRDAAGQPVWLQARYDSPWVPAEKRTNEVLVELEHTPRAAAASL